MCGLIFALNYRLYYFCLVFGSNIKKKSEKVVLLFLSKCFRKLNEFFYFNC